MYDEDDYQPIRALNDLLFCERRCAMHRVEQVWVENRFTLEGTSAHKKVHAGPSNVSANEDLGAGGRVVRGLWLRSERLRLVGIADLVELRVAAGSGRKPPIVGNHPHPSPLPKGEGVERPHPSPEYPLAGAEGEGVDAPHPDREKGTGMFCRNGPEGASHKTYPSPFPETPYPVEYKRGKRRRWDNDDVQLGAQALCLEEMLGTNVPAGAIFHVKSRRRREIVFDAALRVRTEAAARRLHELFASGETPPPVFKPRCRGCSLRELCMPEMLGERSRARRYLRELFAVGDER
jgi:CRISPR/Cas system-associated exonuclease Cas4 (RecB family)